MCQRSIYLACLIVGLVAMAARAQTPPVEQPRTIATSGTSIVYVVPDQVLVTFGVQTFNADLDKAVSANEEQSKKLVAAIKGVGIEDKNLQATDVTVDLRYKANREYSEGIDGYLAHRAYAVKLKDVKKLQSLIMSGLKNGANQLNGVSYETTELRKHRDEARKMAIIAAKEKARDLAAAVECDLGKPRTISEGTYGWGFSGHGGNVFANSANGQVEAPAPAAEPESGETLPLGQIQVTATVTATFDLSPR
jgi:uncharacterized protein YggE